MADDANNRDGAYLAAACTILLAVTVTAELAAQFLRRPLRQLLLSHVLDTDRPQHQALVSTIDSITHAPLSRAVELAVTQAGVVLMDLSLRSSRRLLVAHQSSTSWIPQATGVELSLYYFVAVAVYFGTSMGLFLPRWWQGGAFVIQAVAAAVWYIQASPDGRACATLDAFVGSLLAAPAQSLALGTLAVGAPMLLFSAHAVAAPLEQGPTGARQAAQDGYPSGSSSASLPPLLWSVADRGARFGVVAVVLSLVEGWAALLGGRVATAMQPLGLCGSGGEAAQPPVSPTAAAGTAIWACRWALRLFLLYWCRRTVRSYAAAYLMLRDKTRLLRPRSTISFAPESGVWAQLQARLSPPPAVQRCRAAFSRALHEFDLFSLPWQDLAAQAVGAQQPGPLPGPDGVLGTATSPSGDAAAAAAADPTGLPTWASGVLEGFLRATQVALQALDAADSTAGLLSSRGLTFSSSFDQAVERGGATRRASAAASPPIDLSGVSLRVVSMQRRCVWGLLPLPKWAWRRRPVLSVALSSVWAPATEGAGTRRRSFGVAASDDRHGERGAGQHFDAAAWSSSSYGGAHAADGDNNEVYHSGEEDTDGDGDDDDDDDSNGDQQYRYHQRHGSDGIVPGRGGYHNSDDNGGDPAGAARAAQSRRRLLRSGFDSNGQPLMRSMRFGIRLTLHSAVLCRALRRFERQQRLRETAPLLPSLAAHWRSFLLRAPSTGAPTGGGAGGATAWVPAGLVEAALAATGGSHAATEAASFRATPAGAAAAGGTAASGPGLWGENGDDDEGGVDDDSDSVELEDAERDPWEADDINDPLVPDLLAEANGVAPWALRPPSLFPRAERQSAATSAAAAAGAAGRGGDPMRRGGVEGSGAAGHPSAGFPAFFAALGGGAPAGGGGAGAGDASRASRLLQGLYSLAPGLRETVASVGATAVSLLKSASADRASGTRDGGADGAAQPSSWSVTASVDVLRALLAAARNDASAAVTNLSFATALVVDRALGRIVLRRGGGAGASAQGGPGAAGQAGSQRHWLLARLRGASQRARRQVGDAFSHPVAAAARAVSLLLGVPAPYARADAAAAAAASSSSLPPHRRREEAPGAGRRVLFPGRRLVPGMGFFVAAAPGPHLELELVVRSGDVPGTALRATLATYSSGEWGGALTTPALLHEVGRAALQGVESQRREWARESVGRVLIARHGRDHAAAHTLRSRVEELWAALTQVDGPGVGGSGGGGGGVSLVVGTPGVAQGGSVADTAWGAAAAGVLLGRSGQVADPLLLGCTGARDGPSMPPSHRAAPAHPSPAASQLAVLTRWLDRWQPVLLQLTWLWAEEASIATQQSQLVSAVGLSSTSTSGRLGGDGASPVTDADDEDACHVGTATEAGLAPSSADAVQRKLLPELSRALDLALFAREPLTGPASPRAHAIVPARTAAAAAPATTAQLALLSSPPAASPTTAAPVPAPGLSLGALLSSPGAAAGALLRRPAAALESALQLYRAHVVWRWCVLELLQRQAQRLVADAQARAQQPPSLPAASATWAPSLGALVGPPGELLERADGSDGGPILLVSRGAMRRRRGSGAQQHRRADSSTDSSTGGGGLYAGVPSPSPAPNGQPRADDLVAPSPGPSSVPAPPAREVGEGEALMLACCVLVTAVARLAA